jgi:hypothetical protein
MFRDAADRRLAEEAWEEFYNGMTPAEQEEYFKKLEEEQQRAIEEDWFEQAFADMRATD